MEGKGPWTGRDLAACECSQEGEDQPHDQLHGLRSFCPRRGWADTRSASASAVSLPIGRARG